MEKHDRKDQMCCPYTTKDSLIRVQEYVKRLSQCLSSYSWLHDSFVLEFFTENHWDKLPVSWREVLDVVELPKLAEFLSASQPMSWNRDERVWPLSLQSLRAFTRTYSLNRQTPKDTKLLSGCIEMMGGRSEQEVGRLLSLFDSHWKSISEELRKVTAARQEEEKIRRRFNRRMKPKKEHEIARLAQIVDMVATECGSRLVVDVGSGQGHLSRLLTLGFDLHVVSIEAEGAHVLGAQNLDAKVVNHVLKKMTTRTDDKLNCFHNQTSMPSIPKHLVYQIDSSVTGNEFVKVLSKVCSIDGSFGVPSFILVGLHTCGNLAPTMLKVYSECSEAVALISVACCYMKLDDSPQSEREGHHQGYPMSDFMSSDSNCRLSYEAKEVACHAIEHYLQRLRYNSDSLRIHCYRATLETLITKRYPHLKRVGLHSVKVTNGTPFKDYAALALRKMDIEIPESDLLSVEVEACMLQWRRLIVFYSLRLLIAPVVETLILLDRLLFLWEKGFPSFISAVFDPSISPRNHVLLSMKTGNK